VIRHWLGRLAFSFILLTVVFAYEGYRTRRGDRGPGQEAKMYAFFAAAAACFVVGLRGMRERHRPIDDGGAADDGGEPPRT
jgi:hypothetical protein